MLSSDIPIRRLPCIYLPSFATKHKCFRWKVRKCCEWVVCVLFLSTIYCVCLCPKCLVHLTELGLFLTKTFLYLHSYCWYISNLETFSILFPLSSVLPLQNPSTLSRQRELVEALWKGCYFYWKSVTLMKWEWQIGLSVCATFNKLIAAALDTGPRNILNLLGSSARMC